MALMSTLPSKRFEYSPEIPIYRRRAFSSIMRSFSWSWSGIVADPQDFAEVAQRLSHKNFLHSWKTFETDVLSLTGDVRFQEILKVLAVEVQTAAQSSSLVTCPASMTVFDYQRLCAVLAGYRFAELLILREKHELRLLEPTPIPNICLPLSKNTNNKPFGYERLLNWPFLLSSFKTWADKNASISVPRLSGITETPSPLLTLVRLLVKNEFHSHYLKIENNLLHAALHVYAFNMGVFPTGMIPNLPGEHRNIPIKFADQISQQEYAEATTVLLDQLDCGSSDGKSTGSGHTSLCAPLHLALFISPIYLLSPFRIVKKSFHRRPVIEVAHNLGPYKPRIIVKFENLIWDAVFEIAARPTDMTGIISRLASQIKLDELDSISRCPEELNWFRLSDDLRRLPVSSEDDTDSHAEKTRPSSPPSGSRTNRSLSPVITDSLDLSSAMEVDEDDNHLSSSFRTLSRPLTHHSSSSSPSLLASSSSLSLLHPSSPSTPILGPRSEGVSSPVIAQAIESSRPSVEDSSAVDKVSSPSLTTQSNDNQNIRDEYDTSNAFAQSLAATITMAHETVDPSTISLCPTSPKVSGLVSMVDSNRMNLDSPMDASGTRKRKIIHVDIESEASESGTDHDDDEDQETDSSSTGTPKGKSRAVTVHFSAETGKSDTAAGSGEDEQTSSSSPNSDDSDEDNGEDSDDDKPSPKINDGLAYPHGNNKNKKPTPALRRQSSQTKNSKSPGVRAKSVKIEKANSSHTEHQSILGDKGNSSVDPIDIDNLHSLFEPVSVKEYVEKEEISFLHGDAPVKIESNFDLHAYDADGLKTTFKIKSHFPLFLERIKQFFDHATSDYVNGMPRRFSAPETSILQAITYEALTAMNPIDARELFSSKNVVVTGCPRDINLKFDTDGLRTLTGSMATQISINDFSVMSVDDNGTQTCTPSVLSGIVQDLLDNAEDTDTSKILNALDFPLWDGSRKANVYATDLAAWDVTRGLHVFDASAPYPTGDMRWGVGGLKHSMTFLHIDPDGLNTEDSIGMGGKAWGILRERPGFKQSSINFFLDDGFCLDEVTKESNYDFEIVALRPGDRIYMQPGIPHFVLGMENSICYGGHHFSTSLMQKTLQGIIHSFMLDKFITNTTHQGSRQLLRRILIFYLHGLMHKKISSQDRAWAHLPDLEQFDGLMNLLSVCILVILGNVLDFRTYCASGQHVSEPLTKTEKLLLTSCDINGIPYNERLAMCYTRGAALHLFDWVRQCCIVYGPDGSVVDDLPAYFLVHIGRAMICYKTNAEAKNLEGVTHCSLDLLTSQIKNVMVSEDSIHKMWMQHSELQPDSLALEDSSKYSLKWKAGWQDSDKWTSAKADYMNDGCTAFDSKYFDTQAKRLNAESSHLNSLFKHEVKPQKRRRLI